MTSPDPVAVPARLVEAVHLMRRIRREGRWEGRQTHQSLLAYLVEETWELVDAVEGGDRGQMRDELGDLLLQVLFHAAIAAEHPTEPFDVDDVAAALLDKLRRRAPYWFTEDGPGGMDAEEQDRLWQQAKSAEHADGRQADRHRRGVVDGISWDQPALALGQKVLRRVRDAGIPDDLVPPEMTCVPVSAGGVFHDSGSAELAYRATVREFADRVRRAERALGAAEGDAERWRSVWPD